MSGDLKEKDIHEGHRNRVREKFLKKGVSSFEDHELLEFLLFFVYKRKNTNEIGHALIKEFNTLENVFSASYEQLQKVEGVGPSGAMLIYLIGQMRNRMSQKSYDKKTIISNVADAGNLCMDIFRDLTTERLVLLSLTSNKRLLAIDTISEGDINATVLDVRRIIEMALKRRASAVILAHNHPDDCANPSNADVFLTSKIVTVLEGIDIPVIDHIICGGNTFTSMAERGFIDKLV